jgi:hypothetical protein
MQQQGEREREREREAATTNFLAGTNCPLVVWDLGKEGRKQKKKKDQGHDQTMTIS